MSATVIIFDTETTGLLMPSSTAAIDQPRIIELGAIKVRCSKGTQTVTAELSQLIDPGVLLSAQITKITKITDKDLFRQPKFSAFAPTLAKFFYGADMLIAHNAQFDCGMLRTELTLAGIADFWWPADIVCTAQEYTPMMGYRPSLKDLYARVLCKPLDQKHRAVDDCRAVLELLQADDFFNKIGLA